MTPHIELIFLFGKRTFLKELNFCYGACILKTHRSRVIKVLVGSKHVISDTICIYFIGRKTQINFNKILSLVKMRQICNFFRGRCRGGFRRWCRGGFRGGLRGRFRRRARGLLARGNIWHGTLVGGRRTLGWQGFGVHYSLFSGYNLKIK